MKAIIQTVFLAIAIMALAIPANAGPYEDGVAAYKQGDYATALKFLRPLAEQGDTDAQSTLGAMYFGGQGVPQDFAKAKKWTRMAAKKGLAPAQFNLGEMYRSGLGVPQSDRSAVKWFRKAAEQGFPEAQNILGIMYGHGKGVRQDFVQAHMWLSLASASSLKLAKKNLEFCAKEMTPDQIAEAQRLARKWKAKHRS